MSNGVPGQRGSGWQYIGEVGSAREALRAAAERELGEYLAGEIDDLVASGEMPERLRDEALMKAMQAIQPLIDEAVSRVVGLH